MKVILNLNENICMIPIFNVDNENENNSIRIL